MSPKGAAPVPGKYLLYNVFTIFMCDLVTPYVFVRNTFQAQRKINFDKTFLMHPVNIYDKRFQRYKISDVID